jgi:hypothetical protein
VIFFHLFIIYEKNKFFIGQKYYFKNNAFVPSLLVKGLSELMKSLAGQVEL